MLSLDKYIVDTTDWDSLILIDPSTEDEVDTISVGDKDMISFIYLNGRIYFSNPGLSHYGAAWNFFCRYNHLDPNNQKKYDGDEIDDICDEIITKVKTNGRFWGKYNIIQILADESNVGDDKIISDVCDFVNVPREQCYLLVDENIISNNARLIKINEGELLEEKDISLLLEGSRDNLLLPYLTLIQKRHPEVTMSELKNFLMKKFVTEANIHSLSLGSNFYLSGVARYYFNGDLTTNTKLNIFYPKITDKFIPEVCSQLDEIIVYLRNSYIDTVGSKWEQPEDFGTLSISRLFRKYYGRIKKNKDKENKYLNPPESKFKDVPNNVGSSYTYDIMYSQADCQQFNKATSPGAWCITYGKQHYDGYTRKNKTHFVIFKQNGYEKIPRRVGENFPLDEYGLSLLAVQQSNVDGSFVCCTTRWNHGGYGGAPSVPNADYALSYEQLKKVTNVTDEQFNTIFQIWQENSKSHAPQERGKEKLILTDIIRTFKYAQMMVQNGANLKQLYDNNLIDCGYVLFTDNKQDSNIKPDSVKISKNTLALRTTRSGVSKWTIADRGTFLPEVILADEYHDPMSTYQFNEMGDELSKKCAIFTTKLGNVIYNSKIHDIITVGGIKYFTQARKIYNTNYTMLEDAYNQHVIIDSHTAKPLITPNGECIFEKVRPHMNDEIIELVYDNSAVMVYYYNTKTNEFINNITNFKYYNVSYATEMEKNGILTLQRFIPSRNPAYESYSTCYKVLLYNVNKGEFIESPTDGDYFPSNFKYIGESGYCTYGDNLYNILSGEYLKYPNGKLVVAEYVTYCNDSVLDNNSKLRMGLYNLIEIRIKDSDKYCFYDLKTNKFYVNENGGLTFRYYGRGRVYSEDNLEVWLPLTADGPYWYESHKYSTSEVNTLLSEGVDPHEIFDRMEDTYDFTSDNDGGTAYAIVELNGVKNLLSYNDATPKVVSDEWFKNLYDMSEGVCLVEMSSGSRYTYTKNYNFLKPNGELLFPDREFRDAMSFSEETHLAPVEKYDNYWNLIRKDGSYLLDKWVYELDVTTYNGKTIYIVLQNNKQKKNRYLSKNGNFFNDMKSASLDSSDNGEEENSNLNENKYISNTINLILNEEIKRTKKFNNATNFILAKGLLESVANNKLNDVVDSFEPQDELNNRLWINGKLNSRVRLRLLDIADKFVESLEVTWVKPEDIVITGSLCNYNWSTYSDIDLHILIDFEKVHERTDFVKDYFDSKKKIWNETHSNIKIYGFPVEIYVQDINEKHITSGLYSIEKNEWIKKPSKDKMESLMCDRDFIVKKTMDVINIIDSYEDKISKETDEQRIKILGEKVKKYFNKLKGARKKDLQKNGELGPINIIFKTLRRCGYLKKLNDLKIETFDKYLSIN